MARSYAKLMLSVWSDESDFRDLPAAAQRLYFLLLSHPAMTSCGLLPLQPRRWARLAPDTTAEDVTKALNELVDLRKVIVDEDTEEVLVRTFIKHDGGYRTPNILKAIKASIDRVESRALRVAVTRELGRLVDNSGDDVPPPDAPPPDYEMDDEAQVTSLDETHGETDTERDGLSTYPYDLDLDLQPEAANLQPVVVCSDNSGTETTQLSDDDDDGYQSAVKIIFEHKCYTDGLGKGHGWLRTVERNIHIEDGNKIRNRIALGDSPIEAAGIVLQSQVDARLAAQRLGLDSGERHHDPNCALCGGLGWRPTEVNEYGDPAAGARSIRCDCTEPERAPASVTNLETRRNTA